MNDDMLQQAIALSRAGQKNEARDLLQKVLSANPTNETAWLWLTDCVNTAEERIQILETCLRFVPNSQTAQAGLAALRRQTAGQEPGGPFSAGEAPVEQATDFPESGALEAGALEAGALEAGALGAGVQEAGALEAGAPGAGAEENEWPQMRDQIQLEPWMQEMSDEAGPALGALLGNEEESQGLPGRARAYDNLPTLPVRHPEPPQAFTVPPEQITDEEFEQVKDHTEAELRNRPIVRPLANEPEADLTVQGSQVTGEDLETGPEQEAPEELWSADEWKTAGEPEDTGDLQAADELQVVEELWSGDEQQAVEEPPVLAEQAEPEALPEAGQQSQPEPAAGAEASDLGRTAPNRVSRSPANAAARQQPARNRSTFLIVLLILVLVALAVVIFALLQTLNFI